MSAPATVLNRPIPHQSASRRFAPPSLAVWAGVVAYVVATKLILSVVPTTFRADGQAELFEWPSILLFAVLGGLGVWLADRVGFMPAWDPRVSDRQRLLTPTLIGAAIGAVAVALDLLTRATVTIAALSGQPSFNIDLPGSLLVYSGGGAIVDGVYRLFPVPVLLWLVSNVLLRGRGQRPTFWVLAAVTTLLEPVLQGVALTLGSGGAITPVMLAAYLVTAIANNAAAVIVFRRYGFVASLMVRQGEYLVWHILYGNVIHPWLLG